MTIRLTIVQESVRNKHLAYLSSRSPHSEDHAVASCRPNPFPLHPPTPVVLLSSSIDAGVSPTLQEHGAGAYLPKPVDLDELYAVLPA
jgi:CheY-like chemotaxis protein